MSARKYASLADANAGQNSIANIDYGYDAEGRRVKRALDADGDTPNFTSEYFVYDGSDLSMRFGNAGELTHRYLYGPLVDQVLVDESFKANTSGQRVTNDVLWQLADHQGSIRDVVDANGVERKHTDYDSFGSVTGELYYAKNGSGVTSQHAEAVDALFGYTGQEWDKDTALANYNARWYDPTTGRFISEDPSGFDGGDANLFRYVGNDPINNTDPTGLFQAGNPVQSLFAAPRASDYSAWSRSHTDSSQPMFNGSIYAPSNAPFVYNAWNAPYDPDDSMAGVLRPLTDTAKLFPHYSKTSVVAAGRGLYETGANLVSSAWDHASTLWNDPAAEFNRLDNAKYRIETAVKNTVTYVAQHPIQSVINGGKAVGNYVNHLTSDPEVSGHFGATAVSLVIGNEVAAAAESFAPEWLVGTSRGGRTAEQAIVKASPTAPITRPSFYNVADEGIDLTTYAPKGGSYETVRATNVGGDVHHMPANSISPFPTEVGPAIHMPTPDHAQTASFGNSRAARAYRAQQGQLISKGRWKEAIQMDIDDVQRLFGKTYDTAIQQMLDYARRFGIID